MWDGGVLKSQKKLVDYANTTNRSFTVLTLSLLLTRRLYSMVD